MIKEIIKISVKKRMILTEYLISVVFCPIQVISTIYLNNNFADSSNYMETPIKYPRL